MENANLFINLDDTVVRSISSGPARVFKDYSKKVNSIDFHREHELVITASDDDSIRIYDTSTGDRAEGGILFSKKYGASCIRFTHSPDSVIYATRKNSNTTDVALRYHDLRRNEYLRYFRGHSQPISAISMSPTSDSILSASQDRQVRLWDLRVNMCQGLMNCPSTPVASFDEQGLIFGVATDSGVVKLYDVRSYDRGPFDTFVLNDEVNSASSFTDFKFSNDGKLMVLVIESRTYVLSAFDGKVVHKFTTDGDGTTPMEASISADNKYLLQGTESRSLKIWSLASGQVVTELKGHAGAPACAKWSPRAVLIASACHALAMWLPDLDQLPDIAERAIVSPAIEQQ